MNDASRQGSTFIPLFEVSAPSANLSGNWLGQVRSLLQIIPKTLTVWRIVHAVFVPEACKLLSFSRLREPDVPEEPHPSQVILHEFEHLSRDQQDRVASNLALLWDSFQDVFGGISEFRNAPPPEQRAYMEKLEAAAQRMEATRGSAVAFHYVTVELMRQYVSSLHSSHADEQAVALARLVAPLIDRGHQMTVEPVVRAVKS